MDTISFQLKIVGAQLNPTEAKMPKTRQQKEKIIQNLADKLGKAKSVVFANYRGLTMKQLGQLRNQLRDLDAEFTITKNTLLERALPTTNYQLPTNLEGPTAALLSYDDEISPIKILVKVLKDSGMGKVKFAFLGTESLDEAKILQLATLPAKEELQGRIVGILIAPLQGMVSVLQGNLRNLVYAISEIQKQRGGV